MKTDGPLAIHGMDLPRGFLLGTATAATQIEGGDTNNSWYRWAAEDPGRIRDGSTPLEACDHWNRVTQDIELQRRLGVNAYRMSLEWSRVEPSPGRFDRAALDHYRAEIEALLAAGIRPLVTLHHFSNPLWLEDSGAWLRSDIAELFCRYVRAVLEHLGDLVHEWITINEPNVYLYFGYMDGIWPPGRKGDLRSYFRGRRMMAAAHRAAYRLIHEFSASRGPSAGKSRGAPTAAPRRPSAPHAASSPGMSQSPGGPAGGADERSVRVGVAHHLRVFDAARASSLPQKIVAALYRNINQDWYLRNMRGDFIGVNYYTRDMVALSADPRALFGRRFVKSGAPVNDLGWEIYPDGLYRLCRRLSRRGGRPIIISENGICDASDSRRSAFIADHMAAVARLIKEGCPVIGYFHWTLMDNFEWAEGYEGRFGLYHTDFASQRRTPRPSAAFFAEICRALGGSVADVKQDSQTSGNGQEENR